MYCQNCGKEVPDQACFCANCGHLVPAVSQQRGPEQAGTWMRNPLGRQQDAKPKRSKLPFAIVAAFAVAIAALVVAFLLLPGQASKGPLSLGDLEKTDPMMAQALVEYDADGDRSLSPEEMAGVVSLDVEGAQDVDVLGRFENLRELRMEGCCCQHVDLTRNVNLVVVVISDSPDVKDVKLPDSVESADVGEGASVEGKNLEERWIVDSVSSSNGLPTSQANDASPSSYTQGFNAKGQVVTSECRFMRGTFSGKSAVTVSYDTSGCLEKMEYLSNVADGDVKTFSVANGKVSSYVATTPGSTLSSSSFCEYDEQSRLTRISTTSGSNNYEVTITYAPDGLITAYETNKGNTYLMGAWAYDKQGRLTKYCRTSSTSGAGSVGVATLSYDDKGNCTHAETIGATFAKSLTDMRVNSSYQVDYVYDEKGRAVSATTSLGGKGSFRYDDNGNMTHYEISVVYKAGSEAIKTRTGDITYRRVYVAKGQQVTSLIQAPALSYDYEMLIEPESLGGRTLLSTLYTLPTSFTGIPWWNSLPKAASGAAGV